MSSMSGYITYIKYTAGSAKGETAKKTVFNDPFHLGAVDINYTSSRVVEPVTAGEAFTTAWAPASSKVKFFVKGVWGEEVDAPETVPTDATKVAYEYDNVAIPQNDLPIVNAEMDHIPLQAKARRIAIYYSQLAA